MRTREQLIRELGVYTQGENAFSQCNPETYAGRQIVSGAHYFYETLIGYIQDNIDAVEKINYLEEEIIKLKKQNGCQPSQESPAQTNQICPRCRDDGLLVMITEEPLGRNCVPVKRLHCKSCGMRWVEDLLDGDK